MQSWFVQVFFYAKRGSNSCSGFLILRQPLYQGEGSLAPRLIWPQEHHGPWGPRASDNPPPRKQSSQLGEIISHKHLWKMWQQKKELKKFHCCLPRQNPIGGISIRFHLLREVLLSSHGTQYPISYERPPANSRICSSRRSRSSQSNTGFEAWFLLKFSYFQAQIPDLVRILIFLLLQQLEVSWNRGTPKLSPFIFGFSPEKTIHLGCPDSTRLHPGVSISEHVVAGEDVTAPQSADVTLDVEARARREEAWRTWGCCFYSRKMNMSNRFQ